MFSFLWNIDIYFLLQEWKYLLAIVVSFVAILVLTSVFIKKSLQKSDKDEN